MTRLELLVMVAVVGGACKPRRTAAVSGEAPPPALTPPATDLVGLLAAAPVVRKPDAAVDARHLGGALEVLLVGVTQAPEPDRDPYVRLIDASLVLVSASGAVRIALPGQVDIMRPHVPAGLIVHAPPLASPRPFAPLPDELGHMHDFEEIALPSTGDVLVGARYGGTAEAGGTYGLVVTREPSGVAVWSIDVEWEGGEAPSTGWSQVAEATLAEGAVVTAPPARATTTDLAEVLGRAAEVPGGGTVDATALGEALELRFLVALGGTAGSIDSRAAVPWVVISGAGGSRRLALAPLELFGTWSDHPPGAVIAQLPGGDGPAPPTSDAALFSASTDDDRWTVTHGGDRVIVWRDGSAWTTFEVAPGASVAAPVGPVVSSLDEAL